MNTVADQASFQVSLSLSFGHDETVRVRVYCRSLLVVTRCGELH